MSSIQKEMRGGASGFLRGLVTLWGFLFALWLAVNSSLELPVVGAGLLISLAISFIFVRRSDLWRTINLTPRAAYHFIAYTAVLVVEIVKANINVMRYVYSPRIDIHPGIVKIDLRLKSPIGRLALANSIALTPGSLVLDVRDDVMFIHCLDVQALGVKEATEVIAGPFEKHLGAVFG